jgi:hypothetical protein
MVFKEHRARYVAPEGEPDIDRVVESVECPV